MPRFPMARNIPILFSGVSDSTAPTVTITCAQTSPTAVSPLQMTFTLSEVSTDFAIGDITVTAGTAGNFAGSGTSYTCDITPDGSAAVTVQVLANAFHDAAGNGNTASSVFSIGITKTITLQPDSTADIDAVLYANTPTNNNAGAVNVWIGYLSGTGVRRVTMKFNLTTLPAAAAVSSAILTLYHEIESSSNTKHLSVYRLLRDWVLAQVTWNIYSTGNNWQTAGGFGALDCEQTEIGGRDLTATEGVGAKAITLSATTKAELGAYGWLLKLTDESLQDAYLFTLCNGAVAANRPKLVITYTVNP